MPVCPEDIKETGKKKVREGGQGAKEGESRLQRTVILNPGCPLGSVEDLLANIAASIIKPTKSILWGIRLQHEYFFKAHQTMSNVNQVEESLVGYYK